MKENVTQRQSNCRQVLPGYSSLKKIFLWYQECLNSWLWTADHPPSQSCDRKQIVCVEEYTEACGRKWNFSTQAKDHNRREIKKNPQRQKDQKKKKTTLNKMTNNGCEYKTRRSIWTYTKFNKSTLLSMLIQYWNILTRS